MLVFATPLYFFGISAQLKTVIDRFCAFSSRINMRKTKSAFLSVAWNDDDWTMDAIREHYRTLVRYLNLHDMGMVLGTGCGIPAMTRRSRFPQAAYNDYMMAKSEKAFRRAALPRSQTVQLFGHIFISMSIGRMTFWVIRCQTCRLAAKSIEFSIDFVIRWSL